MTDLGLEIIKNANESEIDVVGPYMNFLDDGRSIRCVSALIRNSNRKLIGMICINLDLSAPLLDFLNEFTPKTDNQPKAVVEHFAFTPEELTLRALDMARKEVNKDTGLSPTERNKKIVFLLSRKGVFDVKGAIDIVAKESGISGEW